MSNMDHFLAQFTDFHTELFDSGGALTTFMHSSCSRALSPHSSLPHYTMPATPRPVLIAHAKVASSEVQMCMPQPPLAL
jgi:hypothetical protein